MISWIAEHWSDILAIYGGIVAISTIIVKWTPSTKDNEILDKIIKFLDKFSTVFTKDDAAKLAAATKQSKK